MKNIVLIEDEQDQREVYKNLLERNGFRVFEAPDGNAGCDIALTSPCDLVLTDLLMPGKEGYETIQELKVRCPEVKIIAMSSGFGTDKSNYLLEVAMDLGADDYLRKPVEIEDLVKKINDLLET